MLWTAFWIFTFTKSQALMCCRSSCICSYCNINCELEAKKGALFVWLSLSSLLLCYWQNDPPTCAIWNRCITFHTDGRSPALLREKRRKFCTGWWVKAAETGKSAGFLNASSSTELSAGFHTGRTKNLKCDTLTKIKLHKMNSQENMSRYCVFTRMWNWHQRAPQLRVFFRVAHRVLLSVWMRLCVCVCACVCHTEGKKVKCE